MTTRGKERLIYQNFTYYKQSRTRSGFRWGCTKNRWHRCKAYLHLADDMTIVRTWAVDAGQTLNIELTLSTLPTPQALSWPLHISTVTQDVQETKPTPTLPLTSLEGHDIRFAKTPTGGVILVLDGYTYSKNGNIRKGGIRFACSKLLKNCKAFVHVSQDGNILKAATTHNHEPPSFLINENGVIVKK